MLDVATEAGTKILSLAEQILHSQLIRIAQKFPSSFSLEICLEVRAVDGVKELDRPSPNTKKFTMVI